MTLETLLLELSRYGQVRIGQYGSGSTGWHCSLNLFVTGKGVSMEIMSEHSSANMTPMQAAMQCSDRLVAALNEMKEQSNKVTLPTIGSGR